MTWVDGTSAGEVTLRQVIGVISRGGALVVVVIIKLCCECGLWWAGLSGPNETCLTHSVGWHFGCLGFLSCVVTANFLTTSQSVSVLSSRTPSSVPSLGCLVLPTDVVPTLQKSNQAAKSQAEPAQTLWVGGHPGGSHSLS